MEMKKKISTARDYRQDIFRAVEIRKSGGCSAVYLFGSLARGGKRNKSDIDLAVRGCPKEKFFHLLRKLLYELEHPVDLVDLDSQDAFAKYLEKEGGLIEVG